jgi:origin recognition complex subunit 6
MINPKYTMTSAKRKEYEEWKDMMLAKIEELIEEDIMDVDMDATGHRKMG